LMHGHPGALRHSSRWSALRWTLEYGRGILGNAVRRTPLACVSDRRLPFPPLFGGVVSGPLPCWNLSQLTPTIDGGVRQVDVQFGHSVYWLPSAFTSPRFIACGSVMPPSTPSGIRSDRMPLQTRRPQWGCRLRW